MDDWSDDPLAPSRGVLFGLIGGLVFYVLLGLAIYWAVT